VPAAGAVGVRELEGKAQEVQEEWADPPLLGPAAFVSAQSAGKSWCTPRASHACKCCAPSVVCR
jgi:hypothetical protein